MDDNVKEFAATGPIAVNLPDIGPMELAAGFEDPTAQFNLRGWMEKALKAQGAKITGKGVGVGGPDLDFEIEGCRFNVQIAFR